MYSLQKPPFKSKWLSIKLILEGPIAKLFFLFLQKCEEHLLFKIVFCVNFNH